MPIIIDANRATDFKAPASNHAPEIIRRIASRKLTVVVGGQLLLELSKTHMRDFLVECDRAGRLKRIDNVSLSKQESAYEEFNFKCNDKHVIALAAASNVRLLYTDDKLLIDDFKDVSILSPKGKIISSTTLARYSIPLLNKYGP